MPTNFSKNLHMLKITLTKEDIEGISIFFTSDTHFCHRNIIKYCNRPFSSTKDMNDSLVENWNKVVSPNDIVFHLGDFCFGDRKTWRKYCQKLNGIKYLIQGNHDRENEIYYDGFVNVADIAQVAIYDTEIEDFVVLILCHYCLTTWPGQWNGAFHCFGHSHTSPNSCSQSDHDYIANRALPSYDVGVDNNNFTPIAYNDLKIIFNKQLLYGIH